MSIAFSGGTTPAAMFRALADLVRTDIDVANGWAQTHVLQVDERIAPDGDPKRNANGLVADLLDPTGVDPTHRHLIPVTAPEADRLYGATLRRVAPGGIDIVVLGLGDDGHTASLIPGDPVLHETVRLTALTGDYRGSRRVTLTRAALDGARLAIWLVTGAAKAHALRQLLDNDPTIPAGLVRTQQQIVFADRDAADGLVTPAR